MEGLRELRSSTCRILEALEATQEFLAKNPTARFYGPGNFHKRIMETMKVTEAMQPNQEPWSMPGLGTSGRDGDPGSLPVTEDIQIQEAWLTPGLGASCNVFQPWPKEPSDRMGIEKNWPEGWCGLRSFSARILQAMKAVQQDQELWIIPGPGASDSECDPGPKEPCDSTLQVKDAIQPVQFFQKRSNMVSPRCPRDQPGCRILDQLQFLD
ncbi:uncharacterized protein LOC128335335 [Hemicordylus capensis]|uniref:uncharacterized protein LOC128335335 n=1 Tax=Hemicordylus capensis TaxID=884348 RepID=UPI002303179C|nr:uncharacterized protein LOC128335335 [Hemicordylus capensis]XP_053129347.1 uncharacterized protein LOC128335335 [Hemicordylus capensis]XP_053129349.1 uncharacterized protein LOC128335335 [Hemicordylus capensis]